MLVIVHKSLARSGSEAWEEGRRDWLYLDQDGLLHQGGPDVSGRDWREALSGRLTKSTHAGVVVNRLVLIVPSVQSNEVQSILGYVLNLPKEDYWIDVGLVSACDLQTDNEVAEEIRCVQKFLADDNCGRMRSIWMIGRKTSLKEPIGVEQRVSAIDYLLQILSQGRDDCAFRIGLIPEGDGQRPPCRLCAWGFRSFLPGSAEIEFLMGAEYRSCIASGLGIESKADKTLPQLMERKADGFLAAGISLDLAFDGQEEGAAKPWRDTLPIMPEAPLRTWQCHILSTGEEMAWLARGLLLQHVPKINDYYQRLVSFLRKQAQNIRLKGQDRLAHISQDARLFVLEERQLHRLSVALRHFFPTFRLSSTPPLPQMGCPNEHDPSQSEVVRRVVHDVIDRSAKRCRDELLTAGTRAKLVIVLIISAAVSGLLFWKMNWDLRALIPVVAALLIVVITDARNRRVFNRIKAAMNAEIEKEQAQLRGEFVRKLEWVLDKTGSTVRTQVAADMTALENLVRRKVDFLGGVGASPDSTDKGGVEDPKPPVSLHLPAEIRAQVRDTIVDASIQILSLTDGAGEVEWDRILEKARRQIATVIEPSTPGPTSPLDDGLAKCCEVETPPFLAQYDGVFNQKVYSKLFLLPRNIPQSWINAIQTKANCGDQQVEVYRSDFKGASVMVRYNNLREDQLRLCFGSPQRQAGQG